MVGMRFSVSAESVRCKQDGESEIISIVGNGIVINGKGGTNI